jgi:ADP-ribosyl-[dinitrogen reductase] hydrolase
MMYQLKSTIYGLAVGDAFGVPFEFKPRDLLQHQVTDIMVGFGTHHQPPGTWSDDTSLTLCLLNSFSNNFSFKLLMQNISKWSHSIGFSPFNECFDIGSTTKHAIKNYLIGHDPIDCGPKDTYSNGNGSLMRISPLAFILLNGNSNSKQELCFSISSVTHGHSRSKLACWYFVEILINLINKKNKPESIDDAYSSVNDNIFFTDLKDEWRHFSRCRSEIADLSINDIRSTGYVIDSLEASIWIFLTTNSYQESIIQAVKLGGDTDTIASITGALTGLFYGFDSIPPKWVETLKGKEIIDNELLKFIEKMPDFS